MLVVIGIIALLVASLFPVVTSARRQAQSLTCASNLRQIVTASLIYATENRGFWPPAHYQFYANPNRNLHRWHGTRATTAGAFVFEGVAPFVDGSPLLPFLRMGKIKACPTFEPPGSGFESAAGGYGYNNGYVGGGVADAPAAATPAEKNRLGNLPAKQTMIRRPSETITHADTAMAILSGAAMKMIEYSFVEPPTTVFGPTSPSLHFRHAKRCNIGWADGHVTSERFEWTHPGGNIYGVDNERAQLGFFGPADNALFDRK